MLDAGRGGVFVACPQGSTCVHFANTFEHSFCGHWRDGEQRAWEARGSTHTWLFSPSHVGALHRGRSSVWNENQCHPCRGEHLSADWPALCVPPFRKDPGFYWLSVHAHVCACACLVTALPVMSFLSSWVPHTRCSSVFQPHTVTPTAAELLNVLLTCPSRETACARPPKSRVFSSTHPLTPSPVLFFSH